MILKTWRKTMINDIKNKAMNVWNNHKVCVLAAVAAFVIGAILF
jgi:ABC-type transport system involved in multi-copper enzyme maturation permease subunit